MSDKNFNCEYCLENFESNEILKKHIKSSRTCIKYRDILFTCRKCNFSTLGLKNIEKHNENCEVQNKQINKEKEVIIKNKENKDNIDFEIVSDDENEIVLNKTQFETETSIKLDLIINMIKKLNNKTVKKTVIMPEMFTRCLDKNENKNISPKKQNIKIIKEPEQVQFYSKNIDIENENMIENVSISSEKSSPCLTKTKKDSYKKMKGGLILRKERTEQEIKDHNENINNIIKNKQNENEEILKDCEEQFKTIFESLKTSRTYSRQLDLIKRTRTKLINCIPMSSYIKLLQSHLETLENIFREKEYPEKKIINTISKALNSLDTRLVYYYNYFDTQLEIDDIQKFEESLKFFNKNEDTYTIFDSLILFKKFQNYGLAIFTIKNLVEIFVDNIYGYSNIIYVPINSSTNEDPFSFYILEDLNIKNKKRYWKMDCRLEDFTTNFIYSIGYYLTQLFRKIYYDIFKDNSYRKDYKTHNTIITEYDCEQILKNIYIVSQQKELSMILRNVVKQKCLYIPTDYDRFNIYSDDPVQKKRFAESKNNIESSDSNVSDPVNFMKNLFDDISNEDAVDLYRYIRSRC